MNKIPRPIFQKNLDKISWKKIYAREYGVQYSEMAILCLSPKAKYHIPKPSIAQVVIPEGNNTAFFIDAKSWIELVESLNNKYTSHITKLKQYEKEFNKNGKEYVSLAKLISKTDLKKLNNTKLKNLFTNYQEKLFTYSVFAWTSFILNNYISEKAIALLDKYIKKHNKENIRQEIVDSLFQPEKLAAILLLQEEINKHKGKFTSKKLEDLCKKYKWLSCLDIHNNPWTIGEFANHMKSLTSSAKKNTKPFDYYIHELSIESNDLSYLLMAKKFVFIKDARDDFRRYGVYHALPLFNEIAIRMDIKRKEVSYLKSQEVIDFLEGRKIIEKEELAERQKGFVLYLNHKNELTCLQGKTISKILKAFHISQENESVKEIVGMVASRGKVIGNVVLIKGIKDLVKVKQGDVLVAITTHPDFVPAMRKASAIVTDEGGITSHAAIVSREFGLPCIVGTKHATKLFKNGDQVEVDAITGRIKKLN